MVTGRDPELPPGSPGVLHAPRGVAPTQGSGGWGRAGGPWRVGGRRKVRPGGQGSGGRGQGWAAACRKGARPGAGLTSNDGLLWSGGAVEGADPFSVLLGGRGQVSTRGVPAGLRAAMPLRSPAWAPGREVEADSPTSPARPPRPVQNRTSVRRSTPCPSHSPARTPRAVRPACTRLCHLVSSGSSSIKPDSHLGQM